MKRTISILGLIGLVGCFLPLIPHLSLWNLRAFTEGWTVYLVIAAFAFAAYAGAAAKSDAIAGLAGLASFGYLAFKLGTDTFDLVFHASMGGILIGVAVIGGVLASIAALATPRAS
ncbi:MAG TPA: hypothetical protein VGC41_19765 [Kofleriaceae bacterium]